MRSRRHWCVRGLTLVELLVVIGLVGILIGLAAPSMRDLISVKRVQGTTDELVTDLQYARGEAARRNHDVRVGFKATDSLSCYVLYVEPDALPVETPELVNGGDSGCDCSRSGAADSKVCQGPGREEIKTVKLPRSSGVALRVTSEDGPIISFGRNSGAPVRLAPGGPDPGRFDVLVTGTARGKLRTSVNATGRPSVCTPDASVSGVPPCQ
jgi:type IV fimbrial biogenesis protein FimT